MEELMLLFECFAKRVHGIVQMIFMSGDPRRRTVFPNQTRTRKSPDLQTEGKPKTAKDASRTETKPQHAAFCRASYQGTGEPAFKITTSKKVSSTRERRL